MTRPDQAVILAGGRGTRMRPLTDRVPKPMVPFHGKPFVEHMIEDLRDEGFGRFLLLLGHLPEVVMDHFGDGGDLGVEIDYGVTGPDDLTASRVRLVEDRLDPLFMLLYCDNIWPLPFDRMWARFTELGAPAMITVYRNRDGYTSDSVRVGDDGMVAVYDKHGTAPGLAGTEISYALLERDTVLPLLPAREELPEADLLFEEAVYPALAEQGRLAAFETDHRYYSAGSLRKLPLTEDFLARERTVILDRDGTLNERPPRAEYVRRPEDFRWLPGALEALRLLREHGFRVVIVSNQAGINRGAVEPQALEAIHGLMRWEAAEAGGRIDAVYVCPHDWDEGCECRKPKPGMLFQAQRDLHLDLSRTTFVGDDDRDGQAADAAGCPFVQVSERHTLLDAVTTLTSTHPLPTR